MDQVKIGNFIKALRKEKGYTQDQLANKLHVSPKTISKWECGKGISEASLMVSLCAELGITINELLSGCHLVEADYKSRAEENLLLTLIEKKDNKLLLTVQLILGSVLIASVLTLVLLASLLSIDQTLRIVLIIIVLVIMILGISCLCVLDVHTGYYKCPKCGETFVPTIKQYIISVHNFSKRKLTCPHCKEKHWCLKVTSKNDEREKQD